MTKSENKTLLVVAGIAAATAALWTLRKKGGAGGTAFTGQFSLEGSGMSVSEISADSIGIGDPPTSFVEDAKVRFVGTIQNKNSVPIIFFVRMIVKIAGNLFQVAETTGAQTIAAGGSFTLAGNTLVVPIPSTSPVGPITALAVLFAAQSGAATLPQVKELASVVLGSVLVGFNPADIVFTPAPGFTIE